MTIKLCDFSLFSKISGSRRVPLVIGLELTARCNLNCRHCYINLAQSDEKARAGELSFEEIDHISDDAVKLGTLWVILTGGEPLLREDFIDIYLLLKKKGLLVSVLTNATLITEKHVEVFKMYPPRSLEVSIYGADRKIYEDVTRTPKAYAAFNKGLGLCLESGLDILFKTLDSKSLNGQLKKMQDLVLDNGKGVLEVESTLISRIDKNHEKSREIHRERLPGKGLNTLGAGALPEECSPSHINRFGGNLFLCNAGINSCWVSSDGMAHVCTTMRSQQLQYDLKQGNLEDYWGKEVPGILGLKSSRRDFEYSCGKCYQRRSCRWCPALSWVETSKLDEPLDFVCSRIKV